MVEKEIRAKTVSGFLYKFAERAGAQGISFVISIILARLLMPDEYGTVALVTIFITICDVFVTYGFGNSLIVNKDSDHIDFSTCLYFGIFLAIILYSVVFFAAPLLARFYHKEILTKVVRVMGIRVLLAPVNSVQHAYVSKHMMFRKFFYATLIGTIISGAVAAIMAYLGCGVWSLVEQYLGNVALDTICLWITVSWRPTLDFSFARLKRIYQYGWKILVTGLIDTCYQQLRSLVIGKVYSSADLAFYNKGLMFPIFTNKLIEPTINTVLFPAMSQVNDSRERMKQIVRKVDKVATYILAPAMVGLFVIAEPMVMLLLTEKWLPCVVYLRIGCIAYLVRPLMYIGNCVIRASGRSDTLLKFDGLNKIIGVSMLIISVRFGVFWIAVSLSATAVIATAIMMSVSGKLVSYPAVEQLIDVLPNFSLAIIMGLIVWLFSFLKWAPILTLAVQILTGAALYIGASKALHIEAYTFLVHLIKRFLRKKSSN